MSEYTLRLKSPTGILLAPELPFSRIEWVRKERAVGWLTVAIPGGLLADPSIIQEDARLEIWRSIDGGAAYLEGGCQWVVRYSEISGNAQDIYIEAADPNYLLDGEIIDYPASTPDTTNAYSDKTDYADDVIKAFVYENIGAGATDTARINPYVTVAADHSLAPSITKQASRRNLLTVCQEVAANSQNAGTYLTWNWLTNGEGWTFETYINQLGQPRDYVISTESGNLLNPRLVFDRRDELTVVKIGGKGEGASRAIGTATSARATRTPFSRRVAFKSGYNTEDTTALDAEAAAMLEEYRPRMAFSGDFTSTDGMTYGVQVFYGDLLTAEYAGQSAQCRIDRVHGIVENGKETLDIHLSGEVV